MVMQGEYVKKKSVLGSLTDPFGNQKTKVKSRYDGRVIGINNNPVVHKGDAILHIAKEPVENVSFKQTTL
jgi:hypothetical protein